jgi:hypothetical protein
MSVDPIRYCIMDNDNGPVAYCYHDQDAIMIITGLNLVFKIDPIAEVNANGYNRFAYEDISQYKADPALPALIKMQLDAGFNS